MAYTTDRTWVAGEVVTAAYLNTYLRDNMKWLSTDKPMVRCYNTGAIATANGVVTPLTFNTNRFDNASLHSTTSLTDRITVSTANAGKYLVGASCEWQASVGGDYRTLAIQISGVANVVAHTSPPGATNGFANQNASTLWSISNTYFGVVAQQNSGGNLNVNATANFSPEFWAVWIGI